MFKRFALALVCLGLASPAWAIPFASDLLYLLDPSSRVLDGSNNVSQWTDLSGNNRNFTQATAGNRPSGLGTAIGGFSTVAFVGDDTKDLQLGTSTGPRTVFMVNRTTGAGTIPGPWGFEGGDKGIRMGVGPAYLNNTTGDGNDFNKGDPQGVRINGAFTSSFTSGTPHILTEVAGSGHLGGTPTYTTTALGGYFAGRGYLGDMAEVAVYNRVLTRGERYQVEQFLSSKYGISLAAQNGGPLAGLVGSDRTDIGNNGVTGSYSPPGSLGGFDAVFFASNTPAFGSENAFNVFDNNKATKWCCNSADVAGGVFVGADFRTTLPPNRAISLTSFTISSDNDSGINRDPDNWAIEGSNDGTTWTTIYSRNTPGDSVFDDFTGFGPDNTTIEFLAGVDFATPGSFTLLRYHAFSSVDNAAHAISELEFFGNLAAVPEPSSIAVWSLLGVAGAAYGVRNWRRRQ